MAVVTTPAIKAHLNIAGDTHDTELGQFVAAAEAVIAKRCGPLEPTAVTERVPGCGSSLVLTRLPVISLTSVTPVGGSAASLSDLYLDTRTGMVRWAAGSAGFAGDWYDVAYSAGRTTCPPDLVLAIKELVRHMWQTQRGPSSRPGSTAASEIANTLPGAAYTFPIRVEQVVSLHELTRVGGFA